MTDDPLDEAGFDEDEVGKERKLTVSSAPSYTSRYCVRRNTASF
jgi:hypothetical protein